MFQATFCGNLLIYKCLRFNCLHFISGKTRAQREKSLRQGHIACKQWGLGRNWVSLEPEPVALTILQHCLIYKRTNVSAAQRTKPSPTQPGPSGTQQGSGTAGLLRGQIHGH